MAGEIIQVVTTTADKESAEKIALNVLQRRHGACVQIGGPIEPCLITPEGGLSVARPRSMSVPRGVRSWR